MRHLLVLAAVPLAAAILATPASGQAGASRSVTLMGPGKAARGTATLVSAPDGVLLKLDVRGLAPGWHALHFHAKADCGDAAFKNAGGHVHAVEPAVHGLLNPNGNDSGDLPNIYVARDGTAKAEIFSSLVVLEGTGSPVPALLDADRSALVIHARPDDHMTQPIGGAGDRVACGVIR